MLVEFRVRNFRSFRDEAVLSLVASPRDKTNEETTVMDTGNKSVPRLLRTAAIYGANASGKSNLVRAMQLLRGIVNDSAKFQTGQTINVQPFLLNSITAEQPIEYEITFLLDNVRYQFGFTLTPLKILSEWLIVYKSTQPEVWYERNFDERAQKYEYNFFSGKLRGAKKVWREATRDNALFLSTAVQLNSEQLRPILIFLTGRLMIFENGGGPGFNDTVSHIGQNNADTVREFLSVADISIADIRLKKQKAFAHNVKFDLATGQFETLGTSGEIDVPTFEHKTRSGSAVFDFLDESEGTQKLFGFAGPIFRILENGWILVVDELDRSLHALLVRQLIGMFQNPVLNQKGAQLIFTTHDTSLLDGELLRRDQIWFAEKDEDQASRLSPLSDFSPRIGEALERGYLSGRYGGVPILRTPRIN
jgi:uncharacterized protein